MIQLYNTDSIKFLNEYPENSIDLIYTDPPYLKKYLYLYEDMAKCANRVLRPGGSFITIVPQYAFYYPEILAINNHLKYRWCSCMWQEKGNHPRMAMGIEVMWKPVMWFVKTAYKTGRGFVRDGFINDQGSKKLHKWQQSVSWAEYLLKFIRPGDVVCDPFLGSGTTAEVCGLNNIEFIGIESDKESFDNCVKRLRDLNIQIVL